MQDRAKIEAMIARCSLGDRAAFRGLYDATSAKLFAVLLRILKDRAEAEDALQEVYIKIWHKAGMYQVNGLSPMTWLITLARNHGIDRLRARRPDRAAVTGTNEMTKLVDRTPGPEALAAVGSELARLKACLAELEPGRGDMVECAYLDGATYKDLAERAGVPLNTVRTWLRRSILRLRKCLRR